MVDKEKNEICLTIAYKIFHSDSSLVTNTELLKLSSKPNNSTCRLIYTGLDDYAEGLDSIAGTLQYLNNAFSHYFDVEDITQNVVRLADEMDNIKQRIVSLLN